MKKRSLTLTLIVSALMAFSVDAQSSRTRITTAEDFLGSKIPPLVYDIEVDKAGFVYFVFPGGLVKFNGFVPNVDWKTEDPFDQLINFKLHKGYQDQILLSGPFGISYIKGDSLIKFPVPDSIVDFGIRGYESVYIDRSGLLHLSPRNKGYYTVDRAGTVHEMAGSSSGINGFVVTILDGETPFIFSIMNPKVKNAFNLYHYNNAAQRKLQLIAEITRPVYQSSAVQYDDGSILFSNGNNDLVHFDRNGLLQSHSFEHKVNKLFIDNNNILWLGTVDHGFYKIPSTDFSTFENFCSGASAVVAQSFDNGLWFKSDSLKFGYIPALGAQCYSDQNGYPMLMDIVSISNNGDTIFVLNEKHQVFQFENDTITELFPPGVQQHQELLMVTEVRSL